MSRLTTSIRDSLLKKLITRAFQTRVEECLKQQAEFVLSVYLDALKDDLPKLAGVPKSWIYTSEKFKVVMAHDVVELRPGIGLSYSIPHEFIQAGARRNGEAWQMPYNRRNDAWKVYEAAHPLAQDFTMLTNKRTDLVTEISRASKQASAAMASVSTVKKLISIWPEVEDLAKEYLIEGERQAILPAIPRDLLNKMLDLPPELVLDTVAGGTIA